MIDVFWHEQVESDVPESDAWLSGREVARLAGLRIPKRRADWRLGRWTAKQAVARCLELPFESQQLALIEIRAAPSGAPEVFVEDHHADLSISLSHRSGVAACAISSAHSTLGCDLETVEPRSDAFIADYFTADEQLLLAQTGAVRLTLIALFWSAKESALKALGIGLRADTRSVSVNHPSQTALSHGWASWTPLTAKCTSGSLLHGWWRGEGELVRTLLATPPPNSPIATSLAVSSFSSRSSFSPR